MSRDKALEHKALGNKEFSAQNFEVAAKHFSDAIAEDPTDHVFYSNRSGCYASLKQFDKALEDGAKCVEIKPDWPKGYTRKGLAEYFMSKYDEAEKTYEGGLKLAPQDAALKEGLEKVKAAKSSAAGGGSGGMGGMDMTKLMQAAKRNPKILNYLGDKDLMNKFGLLMNISKDPNNAALQGPLLESLQNDQRLLELFMAMQGMEMPEEKEPFAPESSKKSAPAPKKAKVEPKDERTEESKKADAFKDEGNALYKNKEFEAAIEKYDKAIEAQPNDITYYNNKAAVLLEQKRFTECEKLCTEVLEKKYEMNSALSGGASFEKVGKVMNRLASCYAKQYKYDEAIAMYQKSLAEDNNKNNRNGLREVEKEKAKWEKESYIDLGKAEEHKEKGNAFFKDAKWVEAKAEYDEAIRRNPNCAKLLSNRAACLQKLCAHPDAIRDLDAGIKLDPNFIKLYSRKGFSLTFIKDFNKALAAYEEGLKIDPKDDACLKGKQDVLYKIQLGAQGGAGQAPDPQQVQEAMKDPEIQAILKDPQMNLILNQMQQNPGMANEAMRKDPKIANAIHKLMGAGILKVG